MDIMMRRESVCMGDDVDDHTITYTITPATRFSDIFQDLIKQSYFPSVSGKDDVVWTLFCCGKDDLISWKTKEDKMYSRFVGEEPAILSVKRWSSPLIDFRYYSSPIDRAKQIFTMFNGIKFHIWHEGFMTEYESYSIPQTTEDEWRTTLLR